MTDRAILYSRLSRRTDTNVPNLEQQEGELRAMAEREGWHVVAVLREIESAHDNIGGRPEFAKMVDLVRAGACDIVAARHPDRFSRDEVESAIFRRDLATANVRMVTSHGETDMANPAGAMMATITGAIAQYESAVKRERLLRKHAQLASAGKRSGGGTRPFGYDGDRWDVVVEHEAAVVREVARRLLAGASIAGEADRLNAEGVLTSTGVRWTREVLSRMMTSGRISGRREHHKAITAVAEWPAIITPEQSDRLRAIHEVNRRRRRRVSRRYLLTGGLARCACGKVLVSRPKQDGRRGYICARETGGCGVTILADPFEAWVAEHAIAAVDGDKLAALVAQRDDDGAAAARLRAVEERTSTLAVDYASGRLPESAYRAALDVLEADRRSALAELEAVSGPDPLAGLSGPLAAVWHDLDVPQQRAVLDRLLTAVTVAPAVRGRNRFDATRLSVTWRV